MIRQSVSGDDDCLFLNVYTPDLNKDAKRAVMVFIHGGGFNGGSGDEDFWGPDFLVEKDVVLVTMNYRLGALGFLNTGDANAPGNAGMKDQVLALKWVRDNIVNFGGCPKRVTIFGQSSGAASVQYHMLSPMSQGLFKHAIMQSGSVAASWAISYTPKQDAMNLADKLGIKASSTEELVQKLAEIPTTDIVLAAGELSKSMTFLNGEMHLFRPSVETAVGQEVFLPADPWELLKNGKIADVPVIVGLTSEDSGLFTPMVLPMASQFNDHFDLFIPIDLNETDPARRSMIGDMLKKFYFNNQPVSDSNAAELTNLLTDVLFGYGTQLTSRIMSSRNSAPVYEYYFTYNAPFGFMKSLFKLEDGAMHGDELAYEFYADYWKNKPAAGSTTEKLINEVVEMFTNFAKEGNPSITMESAKVKWEPMGIDNKYLEIGNELALKKSLLPERTNLWAGIYKDVLSGYANLFN
ncbi:esterase FE4-like isoform X2 [Chelonus insularis]|nr:esterase FE4-like isoform X2 [Chelonus insularis]